jgi:hypothetical protein
MIDAIHSIYINILYNIKIYYFYFSYYLFGFLKYDPKFEMQIILFYYFYRIIFENSEKKNSKNFTNNKI